MKILVINGPNLNMLGIREPDIYGRTTYADLCSMILEHALKSGVEVELYQSNHEGDLVDKIQEANPQAEINTTETTGCVGTWRDSEFGGNVPRYTLLREQFDYDNFDTVWARYYNDPRYFNPYRG